VASHAISPACKLNRLLKRQTHAINNSREPTSQNICWKEIIKIGSGICKTLDAPLPLIILATAVINKNMPAMKKNKRINLAFMKISQKTF
jgi:hypothetical protein